MDIAKQGDVAKVKAAIRAKYGFDVTDAYAADLIRFVEDMTHGPRG